LCAREESENKNTREIREEFKISSISDLMVCSIENEMWMNIKHTNGKKRNERERQIQYETIKRESL
jgi:hypothetical protein